MSNYVIVDLEMCNVPRGIKRDTYGWKDEVIQIGAVVVNEDMEMVNEFVTLVSPEYGMIDSFIERLTGISRMDVQGAPHFNEALHMFLEWLPEDAVLVSWSNSDKKQLQHEMEAKGIVIESMESIFENWVDAQLTFGEKMDSPKTYKLSEALVIADINYDNGEHDALVDARNTAQLFIKMETEAEMKLNPYYSTEAKVSTHNPFAVLLANYNLAG